MDLFALQVDESKLHPNFKQLLSTHDDVAREYLQSMTIGFTDRDNKFVKEFQTTFNSSFWELYLYSVFKKFGFNIDFSYEKPDFVITSPYKLCVEAVIANNAISDTPEYQKDFKKDCPELEEIVKTATIRLANAVISKYKKYKNIYSKDQSIIGKPFIFAAAPFEQPYFWEQTQRAINQVLYGFKKFICENDEINNQRTIKGCEYIDFVTKDNGSEIPLGFFSNNQMPEISAVLFSNVATFGKIRAMTKDIDKRKMYFTYSKYNKAGLHPNEGIALKENYTESLESGLTIFLNPYAKHPIPQEFIDTLPGFTSYDTYNRCINGEAVDGNLINRMVQVFTLRE